jgi:hypothetical protein
MKPVDMEPMAPWLGMIDRCYLPLACEKGFLKEGGFFSVREK